MEQLSLTVRVVDRRVEADDIVCLDLVPVGTAELPPFTAGSHVDVEVIPGLVRQYSLCNSPSDRWGYRIAVQRELSSRGGSATLHQRLTVGSVIRIGEPKNRFELAKSAQHSLLVAGGIGVTPLLSMAQQLQRLGASFELHYYARSPERMAFRNFILSSPLANKATLSFTQGMQPRALKLDNVLRKPGMNAHLYVCGPAGFMAAVLGVARHNGWQERQLHREYFVADESLRPSDATPFRIRIASSGKELEVPADRTVVSVLAEAGIVVPTYCEQGICGTCLTRIVSGIPDHRDVVLSDEEHARCDQFTPCCSRSKSALLVLDL